jgi:hypothetical protein
MLDWGLPVIYRVPYELSYLGAALGFTELRGIKDTILGEEGTEAMANTPQSIVSHRAGTCSIPPTILPAQPAHAATLTCF